MSTHDSGILPFRGRRLARLNLIAKQAPRNRKRIAIAKRARLRRSAIEKQDRLGRIARFAETQRTCRRWISLGETLDWLTERSVIRAGRPNSEEPTAYRFMTALLNALFTHRFSSKIGENWAPRVFMLDASQKLGRLGFGDIAAAADTTMYRDPHIARAFVSCLWVRREDLLSVFNERGWEVPAWLSTVPAKAKTTSRSTATKRIAEAEILPMFEKWRRQQPTGYIPTRDEDIEHMRQYGVSRERVRELRKSFPSRERGEKKCSRTDP
ncbi:hypothetical protein BRADO0463 [Bradyrhizobium sp. ORS 278]|uniref:hypothetical protein n=1 Tax=Bradyrhizobium sp. (strain ORS 278) TaxID=114615 RepID=UPI00015077BA|nr:hypothetical protein [Bradyrhizobium sp. ORS 278]CAL74407.1 hypothetical protein BRADO0463 [Bradyrhizobium sp. ORS 278]